MVIIENYRITSPEMGWYIIEREGKLLWKPLVGTYSTYSAAHKALIKLIEAKGIK